MRDEIESFVEKTIKPVATGFLMGVSIPLIPIFALLALGAMLQLLSTLFGR